MAKRNKQNPADRVEQWPIEKLIPYARNTRTHSPEQVAQIAASVREWGFTTAILVDEDGSIIAGHGRLSAAMKLGLKHVPVVVAKGWTEAQKRTYRIADNKLALNAGWDQEILTQEMLDINDSDIDPKLTGFDDESLTELLGQGDDLLNDGYETADDLYNKKIKIPIYQITGEKPKVNDLYDKTKTLELIDKINNADIPPDIAEFLREAATRHTVFHFRHIAEFYAHCNQQVQDLFEQSAMVIIDFDKAIENGFVNLTKRLADLSSEEEYYDDYESDNDDKE